MSLPVLAALPKLILLYISEPFLSRFVCLTKRLSRMQTDLDSVLR